MSRKYKIMLMLAALGAALIAAALINATANQK
jgi:hypothetical protein